MSEQRARRALYQALSQAANRAEDALSDKRTFYLRLIADKRRDAGGEVCATLDEQAFEKFDEKQFESMAGALRDLAEAVKALREPAETGGEARGGVVLLAKETFETAGGT